MKFWTAMLTVTTGFLLVYGALDMPEWADPTSPPNRHVSPRYVEKVVEETAVPNMVTAVLADYRGYDTLGETTVIFTGGLACILILRRRKNRNGRDQET